MNSLVGERRVKAKARGDGFRQSFAGGESIQHAP